MTYDEAVLEARSLKDAGKSVDEVFRAFAGRDCSLIVALKAVRDAYGVPLDVARNALENQYPALDSFQRGAR